MYQEIILHILKFIWILFVIGKGDEIEKLINNNEVKLHLLIIHSINNISLSDVT